MSIVKLSENGDVRKDLHLDLLTVTKEEFQIYFQWPIENLVGIMLDSNGFTFDNVGNIESLLFCHECISDLKKNKLPKFSLANNLFQGELPEQFKDLTWVEEMTYAIYRSTAYVTHLYDSSEGNQPRVFRGNTCAHDVNIFSTANTLPLTPDDVTGLISVVFIGPGKYSKECLKQIFHV